MNNKNFFFESYNNTVSGMDIKNIYPYTEYQFNTLYSEIFVKIIDKLIKNDIPINEKDLINPSIIRSMLVMDLIDFQYLNIDCNPLFHYYDKYINNIYETDPYSLKTNIPIKYKNIDLITPLYYKLKYTKKISIILNKLFSISYKLNFDIFADNSYEVIGPFYSNNYTYVIYNFNIRDKIYRIYIYQSNINNGIVDMFGHSTVLFNSPCYYIEIDEEPVLKENKLTLLTKYLNDLLKNININDIKKYFIYSRIKRYEKLFNKISVNTDELLDLIYDNIKAKKINDNVYYKLKDF